MCKCVNAHRCMFIFMHAYIHAYMCVCLCMCCLHMCVYVCVLCTFMCMCICIVCMCLYVYKLLPLNHREAKKEMLFRISSICLNYVYVLGVYVGVYIYVQAPVEARRRYQVPLKLG